MKMKNVFTVAGTSMILLLLAFPTSLLSNRGLMINIEFLTFNPYQENTYILFDETNDCIIIDPGCYELEEKKRDKIKSKTRK
jgi:glyoxylase-like metal-dependent hydrolase (beta-lactamase superfamily II)